MIDIYGTLGPSCSDYETLKEMFSLGMTGVRLNLSHVTLPQSAARIAVMQKAAADAGVKPQLLIDMQGPELRVGRFETPVTLTDGGEAVLMPPQGVDGPRTDRSSVGGAGGPVLSSGGADVPVIPVPQLIMPYLKPGQEVLLDDGKLLLLVSGPASARLSGSGAVRAEVLRGGTLTERKSIALPGAHIYPPTLTETDLLNLLIAKNYGVTAVMQPFVRNRKDLDTVRGVLDGADEKHIRLFAKIENTDGAGRLEELLPAADEIVIARGDLGNAVPLWELPGVQKNIAARCRAAGKPFMVVTQMLASMEQNPVPTRAEVSDIFNAVLDGAASVMVTGETAVGRHPAEVIRYLVNTVRAAERFAEEHRLPGILPEVFCNS